MSSLLNHYRYDPLDRLVSHQLRDSPLRQRFYCKTRLATEIEGASHYSIVQHKDQLLAQQQTEGDVSDTLLLVTDQQRSVFHALKSNHSPNPTAYTAYGHCHARCPSLSLLGFNGERPDSVSANYYLGNGYRLFNPLLMRFISPDSWSPFDDGGLNAYSYCQGDPVNNSDASGHSLIPVISDVLSRATAKFNASFISTIDGTTFTTITDMRKISAGVITATSTHKGKKNLIITGHGNKGIIQTHKTLNEGADGLYKLLTKAGTSFEDYDGIRILACYSADRRGQLPSLAESFAQISGRPVKGYHGEILMTDSPFAANLANGKRLKFATYIGIQKGKNPASARFLEARKAKYQSHTFNPPAPDLNVSTQSIRH